MRRLAFLKLITSILFPSFYIAFVFLDHSGVLDRLRGLEHVRGVAERFETSYREEVDRQVGSDEEAWEPLLRLIHKYSTADIPGDRVPVLLARHRAVASAKIETDQRVIAEWTAPSTPIFLLYVEWPGQAVDVEDYRIVGDIGDLRRWADRDSEAFAFFWQQLFFSFVALILAFVVWSMESQWHSTHL